MHIHIMHVVITVKVLFSMCEKIMQIGQNGPLENLRDFYLCACLNVACIINIIYGTIIFMRYNCRLTRIIIRINSQNSRRKMLLYGTTYKIDHKGKR